MYPTSISRDRLGPAMLQRPSRREAKRRNQQRQNRLPSAVAIAARTWCHHCGLPGQEQVCCACRETTAVRLTQDAAQRALDQLGDRDPVNRLRRFTPGAGAALARGGGIRRGRDSLHAPMLPHMTTPVTPWMRFRELAVTTP